MEVIYLKVVKDEWIEKVPKSELKVDECCCKNMDKALKPIKGVGFYSHSPLFSQFKLKEDGIYLITHRDIDGYSEEMRINNCPFCGEKITNKPKPKPEPKSNRGLFW